MHAKSFFIKISYSRHWASGWKWPKVSPEGRSVNSAEPSNFPLVSSEMK